MATPREFPGWSDRDIRSYKDKKKIARKDLRAILKAIEPLVAEVRAAHPDNPKRQARMLMSKLQERGDVVGFVDTWIGPETIEPRAGSWRKRTFYMFRDLGLGNLGMNKALEKLEGIMILAYRARELQEAQVPFKEVIPEELRAFLPDNLVVEVDEDGKVQKITDRFVAKHKTMAKKIATMRTLLEQYNDVVDQVKKDLKSGDPMKQMAAIVTSILMETGIRPGRLGNKTLVRDPISGEKVPVETFGAITLGPSHVRFVRENFADLEFVGKAATTNIASLSDSNVIKLLKSLVDNAAKSGSKFIFVTPNGRRFTANDLNNYFKANFKGISPTDFRKLKATEVVFNEIRKAQLDLQAEIKEFVDLEEVELRQRVVESLVRTLDKAISEAQVALSHDKDETTRKSYINPQILLKFFSQGKAAESLRDAILEGDDELSFDPQKFIQMARVASYKRVARRFSTASLRALLEEIEEAEKA